MNIFVYSTTNEAVIITIDPNDLRGVFTYCGMDEMECWVSEDSRGYFDDLYDMSTGASIWFSDPLCIVMSTEPLH